MSLRGILPLAFMSCPPASMSRIIDSRAIFDIMETLVVLFPEEEKIASPCLKYVDVARGREMRKEFERMRTLSFHRCQIETPIPG